MEKDYKADVSHILESIISIEKYTEGMTFEEFERDKKTVDAVIRNFEIIGEASSKLLKEFRERYPEVPWKSIIGLRNVLIHAPYFIKLPLRAARCGFLLDPIAWPVQLFR